MSATPELPIGEQLRAVRKAKGKTQESIAGLAGVTTEYLGQIERGLKTPTIGVLHAFAAALGVHVSTLLGEPRTNDAAQVHPAASQIQSALMSYGSAAIAAEPAALESLRQRVDGAWNVWQSSPSRFTEASQLLPALTVDVQRTVRALKGNPDAFREASQISADLYFLLRTFTKRIGRADLSLIAADRGVLAAEDADDPLRIGAAKWNLGQILLAHGEPDGAEEVAFSTLDALPALADASRDVAAVRGALALVASIAAMRRGEVWVARDRLRDLASPAASVAGDGNVLWTVFGPTNVDLHAMSIEMESGEASQALRQADRIDIEASPSLERQTTFYLDVARVHEQQHDDSGVFVQLINAEATSPEDMQYNPMARALVRNLLNRARPTLRPQVVKLAKRVGVAG